MIDAQGSSTSLFTEYEVEPHERVVDDGASTVHVESVLGVEEESNEPEIDVSQDGEHTEGKQTGKDPGYEAKKDAKINIF